MNRKWWFLINYCFLHSHGHGRWNKSSLWSVFNTGVYIFCQYDVSFCAYSSMFAGIFHIFQGDQGIVHTEDGHLIIQPVNSLTDEYSEPMELVQTPSATTAASSGPLSANAVGSSESGDDTGIASSVGANSNRNYIVKEVRTSSPDMMDAKDTGSGGKQRKNCYLSTQFWNFKMFF